MRVSLQCASFDDPFNESSIRLNRARLEGWTLRHLVRSLTFPSMLIKLDISAKEVTISSGRLREE